ncbi:hypothetical protein OKW41_006023 [Paraburkholderia sp. UCT70]|uniref:NACHT domain-containing protein n=1 Tax=Paraburkholderia sp. UCT70 TaxID=2991068 RepID=UPI003D22DAD4
MTISSSILATLSKYSDNKLALALVGVFAGAVLTKLIPFTGKMLWELLGLIGRRLGGRLAYIGLQRKYLDWMVTEHRELRLPGIVSAEATKKPKLEQVFVSLFVVEAQRTWSVKRSEDERLDFAKDATWKELGDLLRLHRAGKRSVFDLDSVLVHFRIAKERMFGPPSSNERESEALRELSRKTAWLEKHDDISLEILSRIKLGRLLRLHKRIAILGAPGAGKTTLLQYLALDYARQRAGDKMLRSHGTTRLGSGEWKLPIFLRLSTAATLLTESISKGEPPTILDIVQRTIPAELQRHPACVAYFRYRLERGECLILLDGLDEVATQQEFDLVVDSIKNFVTFYPRNKFVITSRIAGWRTGVTSDFDLFAVENLSSTQVENFVDAWYAAVEQNAVVGRLEDEGKAQRRAREYRAARKAAELKLALTDNPRIRHLAENPMLLSIIALVHRSVATLPRERSKLYGQCSKIFLEQWDISRGVRVDDTNLKFEQKEAILRRVAFAMHSGEIGDKGGGREAARKDVEEIIAVILPSLGRAREDAKHLLNRLIERSGILIERRPDVLSFVHQTFQEFFAAQFLAYSGLPEHSRFLLHHTRLLSTWWREVVLLYAGLIADTSDFINGILTSREDDLCRGTLRLAALCVGEAAYVADETRMLVAGQVLGVRTLGFTDVVPQQNRRPMISYLIDWAKNEDWHVHAALTSVREAQNAGRHNSLNEKLLVSASSLEADISIASLKSFEIIDPERVNNELIDLVIEKATSPDTTARRAAFVSLRKFEATQFKNKIENLYIAAASDSDGEIRYVGAMGLLRCVESNAHTASLSKLASAKDLLPNGHSYDASAYGDYDPAKAALSVLIPMPLETRIKIVAKYACGLRFANEFTNTLLGRLERDFGQSGVAQTVLKSIADGANDEVEEVGDLIILLRQPSDILIKAEAIETLIAKFAKPHQARFSFLALAFLGSRGLQQKVLQNAEALIAHAESSSRTGGLLIVETLGSDVGATKSLISAVEASFSSTLISERFVAARALAVIAPPDRVREVLPRFLKMLDESHDAAKVSALKALGTLAARNLLDALGIEALVRAMHAKQHRIRIAAAAAAASLPSALLTQSLVSQIISSTFDSEAEMRRRRSPFYRFSVQVNQRVLSKLSRRVSTFSWTEREAMATSIRHGLSKNPEAYKILSEAHFEAWVRWIEQSNHNYGMNLSNASDRAVPSEINSLFPASIEFIDVETGWGSNSKWIPKHPEDILTLQTEGLFEKKLDVVLNGSDEIKKSLALNLLIRCHIRCSPEVASNSFASLFDSVDEKLSVWAITNALKVVDCAGSRSLCEAIGRKLEDNSAVVREAAWRALALSYFPDMPTIARFRQGIS